MKIKNGYSDGSGKGTITINNEPILRTHWGCSCCDNFDANDKNSKEMKLADFVATILNKHKKEIADFIKRGGE